MVEGIGRDKKVTIGRKLSDQKVPLRVCVMLLASNSKDSDFSASLLSFLGMNLSVL